MDNNTDAHRPEGDGDGDDSEVDVTNELIWTALIEGRSQRDAAAVAGVSTKTVSRRLQDPGFVEELNRRKRARASELANQMRAAMPLAVGVIVEALDNRQVAVRLRAAQMVVGSFAKVLEAQDMHERMFELEDAVNELKKRPSSRARHGA